MTEPRPRLLVLVDTNAPLADVERELLSFRHWLAGALTVEVIVFGRSASWLPEHVPLLKSAVTDGAAGGGAPRLADALRLAVARPPEALLVVLTAEPAPDWRDGLGSLTDFRAVVTFGSTPASAVGQGVLGAPFRGAHLGLALRWLTCELQDRTWRCACGARRTLGGARACSKCGSVEVPRVVELNGRRLLLSPSARVHPHHLGKPLSFDSAPVLIEGATPDGPLAIEGVDALVRSGTQRTSRGPIEAPLRTQPGQCAACQGQLTPPIHYEPPDPRRFCGACTHSPLRCDFCEVPVGAAANVWPDGRKACRECWTTAVNDVRVLESLAERATAFMSKTLNMDPGPCPVRFEHAAGIGRLNGVSFTPQPGFSPRAIGFYVSPAAGGPLTFIEHGTPRAIAYGVLAHELTHAWQWKHWPRLVPRTLVEGLAMWVEYQALLAEGAIHAARASERFGDPVYGLGFRLALSVEKHHGAEYVKHRLHEVDQWPLP